MISYNTTASCLPTPAPVKETSSNNTAKMIQQLNNKACVLVAMGDFDKANQLLGLALENHKRDVEDCQQMDTSDFDYIDATLYDNSSLSSPALYDDNEYEHGDEDMDSTSNDTFDYYYDCPRDQEQAAPIMCSTNSEYGNSTSKMTPCTHIRNVPCAGHQDPTSASRHNFHKVYSMPIVMDDSEWEIASPDDRSFVLVFNSAMSNHLWGMKLLSLMGTECNRTPFETAKALYLLALETLWNTGNTAGFNGGRIRSVDKLCVPAIFNNLSHASKVLEGYSSQESSVYDSVLLKSVFWWIDGNSSVYASSSSSFNSSDLRRASDGDNEVIEAYLDTVFYLLGAPESIVPAAAA